MNIAGSAVRNKGRAFLITGMTVAVVIAACGGANPPSNASSTASPSPSPSSTKAPNITSVDACSLVKADEASAAVGQTVTDLASAGASVPGACFYGSGDGSTAVLIFAQTYPDATTADQISPDQIAAVLNGQYGVANAKSVNGIGDKAFEYTATSASGNPGVAIFVFKANVIMFIVMSPSTSSTAIEGLARTAAGRLH